LVVGALAVVTGGWPERPLCVHAAALLLYLKAVTIAVGAALVVVAVANDPVMAQKQPAVSFDQ
jgi:hypothetical protein